MLMELSSSWNLFFVFAMVCSLRSQYMPFQTNSLCTQFIVWAISMRAKTGCSWKYLTNIVLMCCGTVIFGFVLMFFWKYKSPFYNFMSRYICTAFDLLLDVIKFRINHIRRPFTSFETREVNEKTPDTALMLRKFLLCLTHLVFHQSVQCYVSETYIKW